MGKEDLITNDTTQMEGYALVAQHFGTLRIKTAAALYKTYDCPYEQLKVISCWHQQPLHRS